LADFLELLADFLELLADFYFTKSLYYKELRQKKSEAIIHYP
jgi:hypothetical protein